MLRLALILASLMIGNSAAAQLHVSDLESSAKSGICKGSDMTIYPLLSRTEHCGEKYSRECWKDVKDANKKINAYNAFARRCRAEASEQPSMQAAPQAPTERAIPTEDRIAIVPMAPERAIPEAYPVPKAIDSGNVEHLGQIKQCFNEFGGPPAVAGQFICGLKGMLHYCECNGFCRTVPTGQSNCIRPGAVMSMEDRIAIGGHDTPSALPRLFQSEDSK
jgi:hypothetical protein